MLGVGLVARETPLAASAALGLGPSAVLLARRLLEGDSTRLERLRGLAGAGFVLVLGTADDLPWCDGVGYLGRDHSAPKLLLPTAVGRDIPSALLERALSLRFERAEARQPWAVWLAPAIVIPAGDASPIARAALEHWLEHPLPEGRGR